MKNKLKVFIATSSFNEKPSNIIKEIEIENYEFLKNPLKKKLTNQQLIKYAKDCEFIIAGTDNYDKDTINKLSKLKYLFRMGSGVDNIDTNYLKKKKNKIF